MHFEKPVVSTAATNIGDKNLKATSHLLNSFEGSSMRY